MDSCAVRQVIERFKVVDDGLSKLISGSPLKPTELVTMRTALAYADGSFHMAIELLMDADERYRRLSEAWKHSNHELLELVGRAIPAQPETTAVKHA